MISELVGAVFASARTDSKKQIALWFVLGLLTIGAIYFYSIQPLSTKQTAKVQSMEMVSTKFNLEKTMAKLKEAKSDGVINIGEYWDIKDGYKNESFDKNYELIRANKG